MVFVLTASSLPLARDSSLPRTAACKAGSQTGGKFNKLATGMSLEVLGHLLIQLSSWNPAGVAAVEASGAGVVAGVRRALQTRAEALIACPHMLQSEILFATFQQEVVGKDRFTKG